MVTNIFIRPHKLSLDRGTTSKQEAFGDTYRGWNREGAHAEPTRPPPTKGDLTQASPSPARTAQNPPANFPLRECFRCFARSTTERTIEKMSVSSQWKTHRNFETEVGGGWRMVPYIDNQLVCDSCVPWEETIFKVCTELSKNPGNLFSIKMQRFLMVL